MNEDKVIRAIFSDQNPFEESFEGIELATKHKDFYYHNPIMTQRFGADPYAMVYGDRVYVYMTNDIIQKDSTRNIQKNEYSRIKTINRLSSDRKAHV